MIFNKTILLLGAGFSANFGGLLARDMWAKIFNHPALDSAGDVKLSLRDEFNFETVYSEFFSASDDIKKGQFKILEQILQEVYETMNDRLLHLSADTGININSLQNRFINLFVDDNSGGFGACFSLNQDLFFEKHFNRHPLGPEAIQYGNDPRTVNPSDLTTDKILPNIEQVKEYRDRLNTRGFGLIKLHGSLNWKTAGGDSAKVIGINKPEIIDNIPLLSWYRELFAEAVSQRGIKLVIYGYSFNDIYINDIILRAIHGTHDRPSNDIKIYIISTENPEQLKNRLEKLNQEEIWTAVDGYFPYYLKDIIPTNELETEQYKEIIARIDFSNS